MADQKEQAKQDYLKGMKYKDIAEKYNVTLNTVKSWKTRYKWDRKSVHTQEKSVHTKRGAPKGNKNAKGNRGGSAPKQNKNSVKHGLFAKYLPEETLQVIYQMEGATPVDILWMNIEIQFAQILRAQQLMHVTSQDDLTKELKRQKQSDTGIEVEYEIQFAWDKHATFLTAQSRAMTTLQGLFRQFDEMAHSGDERRLKLEQMKLNIKKTNAEIENITSDGDEDKPIEIVIKRKGERS